MFKQTPFSYLKRTIPEEFKWMFLNGILYGTGTVSMLFATETFGKMIDQAQKTPQIIPYESLAYFALALLCYEAGYRSGHTIEITLASRVKKKLKNTLLDYTLSLPYSYFVDRFAGGIAHRISNVANSYESLIKIFVNGFIENIILVTGCLIMLTNVHWTLSVGLFIWVCVFLLWIIPIARRLNRLSEDYAGEETGTTGLFVDTYTNIGAVKVYGDVERQESELHKQIDREFRSFRKLGWQEVLLFHYQGMSGIILSLGLISGAYFLFSKGTISVGELVFTLGMTLKIFWTVWEMGPNIASYNRNYGECLQGISDILVPSTLTDPERWEVLPSERSLSIAYENVDFSYLPTKSVLNGFSFNIPSGQRVGIVGTSGSGKTTLINLLLRFYDVNSGNICVDGKDVRSITQEHLRSKIAHVSQDTTLFHKSILENIRYSRPEATIKEVEQAAEIAHAHEFIISLPNGYDTMVWDRGVKLSGGQRQRIAIARAILKDAPIFLLDEATSALDSESEKKVQSAIHDLMDGRTVIAVAHRLSTLLSMDRIVVMNHGKIVEDGTHHELLEKNGIYKKLWDMQVGGFIPEAEEFV